MQLSLPLSIAPAGIPSGPYESDPSPLVSDAVVFVRHRRARRYILRVLPDGTLRVTLPRWGAKREARAFIEASRAWIVRQRELRRRPTPPEIWRDGTCVLIDGVGVPLSVDQRSSVQLTSGPSNPSLHLGGQSVSSLTRGNRHEAMPFEQMACSSTQVNCGVNPRGSTVDGVESGRYRVSCGGTIVADQLSSLDGVRPAVERWLRARAKRELPGELARLAARHEITVTRVSIRDQRSRWGACSPSGTITLNWRLVQTPPFVREYVLLHELMHRRELNHSRRFWRLVAACCPRFAEARRWLREEGKTLWPAPD